jgi:hypothetical protein
MTIDNDSNDTPSEEELEQKYSDDPQYTVDLNGKRYALNNEARKSIQRRAELEYEENTMFSCWWKVASKEQYTDEQWENNVHEEGDPVLVIETEGIMVPWENLDKLNVEMQDADPFGGMDSGGSTDAMDSGNGMQTLDPNDKDDNDKEKVIGRTHFEHSPQSYEEVPSPDGEEGDKIPPKPVEMGDDPLLVKWIPDHPDITHTWSAGEAIIPTGSWVEWNVQARANQPRLSQDKENSHDHWEALLGHYDCPVVGELGLSQEPGADSDDTQTDNSKQVEDMGGKYGGDNWKI